jgi:hypothetical protein
MIGGRNRKCPAVMQKSTVRGSQGTGVDVAEGGSGVKVGAGAVDVEVCVRVGKRDSIGVGNTADVPQDARKREIKIIEKNFIADSGVSQLAD